MNAIKLRAHSVCISMSVIFGAWLCLAYCALRNANETWLSILGGVSILLFACAGLIRIYGTAEIRPFASGFLIGGLGFLFLQFAWTNSAARSPGLLCNTTFAASQILELGFRIWNPAAEQVWGSRASICDSLDPFLPETQAIGEMAIRRIVFAPIGHRVFALLFGLLGGLYAQRLERRRNALHPQ